MARRWPFISAEQQRLSLARHHYEYPDQTYKINVQVVWMFLRSTKPPA